MQEERKLKAIASRVLSSSTADQTEVLVGSGRSTSLRFANNYIHQPTSQSGAWLKVRVIVDKKIGVASTSQITAKGIADVLGRAGQMCRFQQPDPAFVSLPTKQKIIGIDTYDDITATIEVKQAAKKVTTVIAGAQSHQLTAAGNLTYSAGVMAVANNLGVWAYQQSTNCSLSTVVMGERGSGYASQAGWRLAQISEETVAATAVNKALASQSPIEILPGSYEVVLEPSALEDLLNYFAWLGPNARVYHEDVSYFKGKLGKRLFSDKLTIIDDPFDLTGLPTAFDYEGHPKKKLTIIDKGVVKGIAYDSYYSHKYNQTNTGHALPAPNTFGPIPGHLVIKPGSATTQQMIGKVKKGLLVTRFWYLGVVHFGEMLLTGMTRDGLFLIEDGQITRPVNNMRFTESIPNIFKNIIEIGRETKLCLSWADGAHIVPAMRIAGFRFTGKTDF